ncbi:MAG: hypothetical protein ACI4TK_17850 [Agathobacter sp.]
MKRIEEIDKYARKVYEDNERITAFITGAIWADNNPISIWHSPKEEPQGERWNILCEDEDGNCWTTNNNQVLLDHGGWNEYVSCELVVSWVYIDDVFGNSEQLKGGEK